VWHVRRASLKNVGNKVKGRENQIRIFRGLGEIMHMCKDDESVRKKVESLFEEFSEQIFFLEYFRNTWLSNNKICKLLIGGYNDSIFHVICILMNI
jgi:hypothetical protein